MKDLKGSCPICEAKLTLPKNTEASEIILCSECKTRLVVDEIHRGKVSLSEAPPIEEDWGE